jgi:hypothetical protein
VARAVAKLTHDPTAAKRHLGFISAIGLQFLQMARASTVFGASNHNSAGIAGDLSFYEAPGEAQRMHHRIRIPSSKAGLTASLAARLAARFQ